MKEGPRIEKAKWLNGADSPVMFMVDDFTNVWIDLNGNGRVDPGEDWGHALDGPGSAFRYLTEEVLRSCPAVKTTFFTPMARVPVIREHGYRAHFGPINENEETARFFASVHRDERFEIAYHGLSHGVSGARTEDFVHEWVAYGSLEEAMETVGRGKEIYFEVFGEYPRGGKYCGYGYNSFSDESIDKSGFLWWCRKWDRGQAGVDDTERFDVKYFGENRVIDIPSTVYGAMFNLQGRNKLGRAFKRPVVLRRGREEIDRLLEGKLVISIQEHLSPARTDGRRQTPNTLDDRESLKFLFDYLGSKNVWFCTGTELAEYVYSRDNTVIEEKGRTFLLDARFERDLKSRLITLVIKDERVQQIRAPDGGTIPGRQGLFTFPAVSGRYDLLE
ncbi:MAG: hypothetical protein JSW03_06885 [Candidatus Eiseniibacteriota bacterium]|nr:MAG: hypothetical protein JSW03_06885 [Candidatus Eisenbacteria bacterium]